MIESCSWAQTLVMVGQFAGFMGLAGVFLVLMKVLETYLPGRKWPLFVVLVLLMIPAPSIDNRLASILLPDGCNMAGIS